MSDAATFGREPIQFVELDCDHCQNTYSVAPCTAGQTIPDERLNIGDLASATAINAVLASSAKDTDGGTYLKSRLFLTDRDEWAYCDLYTGASRTWQHSPSESQPQNRILRSIEFDDATWQKPASPAAATVTANDAVAPDGATTADRLNFASNAAPVHQDITVDDNTNVYTASVWVKQPPSTALDKVRLQLLLADGTGVDAWCDFDFGTETATAAGSGLAQIREVGAEEFGVTGWYRVWVTAQNNASGNTTLRMSIGRAEAVAGNVYVWGAMVKNGKLWRPPAASTYPPHIYTTTVAANTLVNLGGFAENVLLHSDDLDNAYWSKGGTPAQTKDGEWWVLTDNDGAAWEYIARFDTVPNDSAGHMTFGCYIKKTTGLTQSVMIRVAFTGGTNVYSDLHVNSNTGASVLVAAALAGGVYDCGDRWFAWVSGKNNGTGNTTRQVSIWPAIGPNSSLGTYDVAAQGTARFAHLQLCVGENNLQRFIGTTSAAVARPTTGEAYEVWELPGEPGDIAPGDPAGSCYNTFATCQDPDNYVKGVKTLRFVSRQQTVDPDWQAIPSLIAARTTPTKLNVGGTLDSSSGLGNRATCTAEFQDHPDGDLLTDPYVAARAFDPRARGTFWTKWIARHPYFARRPMRVLNGYVGQPLEEFRVLHYVMDRINGPDSKGRVTLHGTDVLRFADAKKAQAPVASRGILSAGIGAGDTSLTMTGGTPAEYIDAANRRRIRIGDEVMSFASITGTGPYTFNTLTRGVEGTTAASHASGDTIQNCLRYHQTDVWDIVYDLLTTWTGIDPAQLDFAQWEDEGELWLSEMNLTAVIAEPHSVADLLAELAEQCQFFLWWDEREAKVKLKAQRSPTEVPETIREEWDVLLNSQVQRLDPEQRISQVWLSYQQVSPVRRLDDEGNYRRTLIRVDADAEGPNEYDESRVKKIFSRWLATEAQANDVSQRILLRFRNTPRLFSLQLDAKDRERWWTSDVVLVQSRLVTDAEGLPETRVYQVIAAEETVPGEKVSLELQSYDLPVLRLGAYTRADMPDFGDATEGDLDIGAWYSGDDGLMPDDSEAWVYQ